MYASTMCVCVRARASSSVPSMQVFSGLDNEQCHVSLHAFLKCARMCVAMRTQDDIPPHIAHGWHTSMVTIAAGDGICGRSRDTTSTHAQSIRLNLPEALAYDGNGRVFVSDTANDRYLRVSACITRR